MFSQVRFRHVRLAQKGIGSVGSAGIFELVDDDIDLIASMSIGLKLARYVSVLPKNAGLGGIHGGSRRAGALRSPSGNGRGQNALRESREREQQQYGERKPGQTAHDNPRE